MKIKTIISFANKGYGSGRAAYNQFKYLDAKKIIYFNFKKSLREFPVKTIIYSFIQIIQRLSLFLIYKNLFSKKSLNLINFNFVDANNYPGVNINWINNDFIALNELSNIKKKTIITLHDLWLINTVFHHDVYNYKKNFFTKLIDSFLIKKKKKIFLNKNIKFVVPSKWVKNKVLNSKIFSKIEIKKIKKKILIIPNFSDDKHFCIKSSKKNIYNKFLVFKYPDYIKGYDNFLNFLNKSKEVNCLKNSTFIIIGQNFNNNYYYKKFKNFNFIFYNYVDRKKLLDIYNEVDFTFMLSRAESFSLVSMESLLCGTPVISFKYNANNEFVKHKKNGFLFNKINKNELKIFYRWISSKNLLRKSIRNSISEKYHNEKIKKKWNSINDISI